MKLVWSSFSVVAGASGLFSVELLLLLWTELWFCTTECDILRQVHLFFSDLLVHHKSGTSFLFSFFFVVIFLRDFFFDFYCFD